MHTWATALQNAMPARASASDSQPCTIKSTDMRHHGSPFRKTAGVAHIATLDQDAECH